MKLVLAKSISHLFSPLTLWPALLLLLLVTANHAGVTYQPMVWAILALELVLPIVLLVLFMKFGLISDVDVTHVKERRLFFILVLMGHAVSAYLIAQFGNDTITEFRLWLLLVEVVGTVITFAWKISGHLAINSAVLVALLMFSPWAQTWMWGLWLIVPVVAWSRVVLHKHTVAQTIAGTALPIIMFLVVSWVG